MADHGVNAVSRKSRKSLKEVRKLSFPTSATAVPAAMMTAMYPARARGPSSRCPRKPLTPVTIDMKPP